MTLSARDAEIVAVAELFHAATPEQRKALLATWWIEAKKVVL